jgi:hypothetical protein
VLVLGGTREAWLPYVIDAFHFFYDQVICLWDDSGAERLQKLSTEPSSVPLKHRDFWTDLRIAWARRDASFEEGDIPAGLVRYRTLDALIAEDGCKHPSKLRDQIARYCMEASIANGGTEWDHFVNRRWGAIEMSRSFFNPQEAIVELSLIAGNFVYQGGVARDIEVPSLLHQLGMRKTKLSEDFVLHSEALDKPVYIQCKASGGGRTQHGKNIQNRTKEQVARGVLYSAQVRGDNELAFVDSAYHWISVLDGNWGVTKREQHKYLHMLHLAGYNKYFSASDLLDGKFEVRVAGNKLVQYLEELRCRKKP